VELEALHLLFELLDFMIGFLQQVIGRLGRHLALEGRTDLA
jgi:hypothetical protein